MSAQATDAIPVRILYEPARRPGGAPAGQRVPSRAALVSHAALVVILITLFFRWEHERLHVVFGADPAGYLRQTQLICQQGFLNTVTVDPEVPTILAAVTERHPEAGIDPVGFFLTPLSFLADEQGRVHSQYPPGFALTLSVFYRLGGEPAVYYAQPIFLLAGLLIGYVILWRFVHPLTALMGTAAVAGSNWYFAESTLLMADHEAMCLVSAALLFALLMAESSSRWALFWALLCGAAAGYGVMVRYVNLLAALPLLIVGVIGWRRHGIRWALSCGSLVAATAMAFGGLPLLLYQHSLFGTYFQPTYTSSDLTPGNFGLSHLSAGLAFYAETFDERLGLWGVPAVVGLVGMALVPRTRPLLAVWVATVVAFGGFHLCVKMRFERYLLVLVPLAAWPVGVALGMFFDALGWWAGRPRAALTLAMLLSLGYFAARVEHLDCGISDPLPRAEYEKLSGVVPAGAVILCDTESGAIPIYANRRTCRLAWQPTYVTDAVIDYWVDRSTPVYCLVDSGESRQHFEELQGGFARSFEPTGGPWRRWKLFRLADMTTTRPQR